MNRLYRLSDKIIRVTMNPEVSGGIVGWALQFTLRDHLTSGGVLYKTTIDGGITITSAQQFLIQFDSVDLQGLRSGEYVFDVWRVDSGFKDSIVKNAKLYVDPSVFEGLK